MTMTNKNAVENIDEIVMRLREIRRDAEDNGGSAYELGRFGIEATTRAIVDMLTLRENFQIQIEAEAESSPEAADEPKIFCGHEHGTYCICDFSKNHKGDHRCDCGNAWANETEAPLSPETETQSVKVGDKLRILNQVTGHHFTIGQTVIVESITPDSPSGELFARSLDGGERWFIARNEYEVIPETQLTPKPEGMTVAELIRELGAMPDKNATVRISNPFGNNFCVQEIGQHSEGGYVWVRDRISVNEN